MNEAGTGTTLTTASSCGVDKVLAPYLNNKLKTKTLVEEPAFEEVDEYKDVLPPSLSGPDLKVRIPPELMPDEETVLHYFDMYFSNVTSLRSSAKQDALLSTMAHQSRSDFSSILKPSLP